MLDGVHTSSFRSDGRLWVHFRDGRFTLFDPASGARETGRTAESVGPLFSGPVFKDRAAVMSSNGWFAVVRPNKNDREREIAMVDHRTGAELRRFSRSKHAEERRWAFAPDGDFAAVDLAPVPAVDSDKAPHTVELWDTRSWTVRRTLTPPAGMLGPASRPNPQDRAVTFSPDGRTVTLVGYNGIARWDVSSGAELPFLRHEPYGVNDSSLGCVAVLPVPDSTEVLGIYTNLTDTWVRVWDGSTGRERR
jgi:WD40 repeat protein